MSSGPVLPAAPVDTPAPTVTEPAASGRKTVCEFCHCALTPTGDVFKMSDEARAFNKQTETIAELRATLQTERDDHDRTKRELSEAQAALKKATGGFWRREVNS